MNLSNCRVFAADHDGAIISVIICTSCYKLASAQAAQKHAYDIIFSSMVYCHLCRWVQRHQHNEIQYQFSQRTLTSIQRAQAWLVQVNPRIETKRQVLKVLVA